MEAMSDANEERLLTSLLREVAEADACIKARADLKECVLSRRERSRAAAATWTTGRATLAFAVAAAVLLAVAGSVRFRSAQKTAAPPPTATAIVTTSPDAITESIRESMPREPVMPYPRISRQRRSAR